MPQSPAARSLAQTAAVAAGMQDKLRIAGSECIWLLNTNIYYQAALQEALFIYSSTGFASAYLHMPFLTLGIKTF